MQARRIKPSLINVTSTLGEGSYGQVYKVRVRDEGFCWILERLTLQSDSCLPPSACGPLLKALSF